MAIYGHDRTLHMLRSRELPKVSFFHGPKSVGKWSTAEYLRAYNEVAQLDVVRIHKLTADRARALAQITSIAPLDGRYRLAIVRTDGATQQAQNILLKALEAENGAKFILMGEKHAIPPVMSRAMLFEFGLLSDEVVERIIVERKGVASKSAPAMAARAGGQVEKALLYSATNDNKVPVIAALAAINLRDAAALERVAPLWSDDCTNLLASWCVEKRTGQWKFFTDEDIQISNPRLPLRILRALRSDLRPKFVVRAGLMAVLRET